VARGVLFRFDTAMGHPIMQTLGPLAAALLDRMEPDRGYEALELRTFVPEVTIEGLGEIMHELWVHRHVERFGYSGWRRHRSTSGISAPDPEPEAVGCGAAQTKGVKPEDLFDHDTFSGFFK